MLTRSLITRFAVRIALVGALFSFVSSPARADTASDIATLKTGAATLQSQVKTLQDKTNPITVSTDITMTDMTRLPASLANLSFPML